MSQILNQILVLKMQAAYTIYTVLGIAWGDEGKGKIVDSLVQKESGISVTQSTLSNAKNYSYDKDPTDLSSNSILCARFNGGSNAGHMVRIEATETQPEIKIPTRQIPSGIITPGIVCMIGPSSLVNISQLIDEIKSLEEIGIVDIRKRLLISDLATIVTTKHIESDIKSEVELKKTNKAIGTTSNGIGPASASRMARTATLVRDHESELQSLCTIINCVEFFKRHHQIPIKIILEGAQSTELDIYNSNYPYVTSSTTNHWSIYNLGICPNVEKNILICVTKAYETYVGDVKFQPDDEVYAKIVTEGKEFGTVTGRRRQVNAFDYERVFHTICRNCPNNSDPILIINKGDVLKLVAEKYPQLNPFLLRKNDQISEFISFDSMKEFLIEYFVDHGLKSENIIFSNTPYSDIDMWSNIKN